ncbi:MAG: hypothetical protein GF333_03775 [Candidatus Omnitrophica bacterium]|nr:hypothetical protein [Candidatus Omnitrophota bacterium]
MRARTKIFLTCLFLFLASAVYGYIAMRAVLPQRIAQTIRQSVRDQFGKEVRIGGVSVEFPRDIRLTEVRIHDPVTGRLVCAAEAVHVRPALLPFLFHREYVLTLKARDVRIVLARDAAGKWNFSPRPHADSASAGKVRFLRCALSGVQIEVADEKEGVRHKFAPLFLDARIDPLSGGVRAEVDGENLAFRGTYDFFRKKGTVTGRVSEFPLALWAVYFQEVLPADVTGGVVRDLRVRVEYAGTVRTRIDGTVTGLRLRWAKGEATADVSGTCVVAGGAGTPGVSYDLTLARGTLRTEDFPLSLRNISGHIRGTEEKSAFSAMTVQTGEHTVEGNGEVWWEALSYRAQAGGTLPVQDLFGLWEQWDEGITVPGLSGRVNLDIEARGKLFPAQHTVSGSFRLENGRYHDCRQLALEGTFSPEQMEITQGRCVVRQIPVQGKGKFSLRAPYPGKVMLNAGPYELELSGEYDTAQEAITVPRVRIDGEHTRAQLRGKIFPAERTAEVSGTGIFSLDEVRAIAGLIPAAAAVRAYWEPLNGSVRARGYLRGGVSPQEWETKLILESDACRWRELQLEDLRMRFERDARGITLSPFQFRAAGGTGELRIEKAPGGDETRWNLTVNGMSLNALQQGLGLQSEEKPILGVVSCEAGGSWAGEFSSEKIHGRGLLEVRDGDLWKINFLKGLGKFLFIPDFETIVFDSGNSKIRIEDNTLFFEELRLHSWQMELAGAGKVNRDQEIEFVFFPEFNPNLVAASQGLQKVLTEFLGKSGLVLRVGGTLEDPDYSMKPAFFSPLKKIQNFFEQIIQ